MKIKKYDLHMHTTYSLCSSNKPKDLLEIAKKQGLDGIAITDHNCIKGAQEVKKLNKDKDFEVIIGEEIKTDYGDLIALYIKKEIINKDFFKAVEEVKKQGGITIIPHPFRPIPWLKFKYPIRKLVGKIDAIEVFNSRNIGIANKLAEKSIEGLDFAKVGSSDAHLTFDIGKGYTLFKGDLREAIKNRTTKAEGTTRLGLISGLISSFNKRILAPIKVKKL